MVKISRCGWCGDDRLYVAYHDAEWGVPVRTRDGLFERLMLESMQAGLSFITVLRKRERMREQFFEFQPEVIAEHGPSRIEDWLADPGLIRHRGKLTALITNARACLALGDRFGDWIWSFVDGKPIENAWQSLSEVPAESPQSTAMAKGLRGSGFKFIGPTACYAFMQSAGLVNDHVQDCFRHQACRELATQGDREAASSPVG